MESKAEKKQIEQIKKLELKAEKKEIDRKKKLELEAEKKEIDRIRKLELEAQKKEIDRINKLELEAEKKRIDSTKKVKGNSKKKKPSQLDSDDKISGSIKQSSQSSKKSEKLTEKEKDSDNVKRSEIKVQRYSTSNLKITKIPSEKRITMIKLSTTKDETADISTDFDIQESDIDVGNATDEVPMNKQQNTLCMKYNRRLNSFETEAMDKSLRWRHDIKNGLMDMTQSKFTGKYQITSNIFYTIAYLGLIKGHYTNNNPNKNKL